MGITLDKYFENIYSVIFSPKAFFNREDMTISIRLAIATVTLITIISQVTMGVFDGSITNKFFAIKLISCIFVAIFIWFITAIFFEYTAKIFGKDGQLTKLLFLTSFAPIPYIFFAPLNIIKSVNIAGYFFGAYCEFFLYLWIIFLYVLCLNATYKISIARSFMLMFLPFIASFFALYWIICFFKNICYIFSI